MYCNGSHYYLFCLFVSHLSDCEMKTRTFGNGELQLNGDSESRRQGQVQWNSAYRQKKILGMGVFFSMRAQEKMIEI